MKNVCAQGNTLKGIDISHWDPIVNWDMLKAAGLAYIFLKATEGTDNVDPKFQSLWAGAKAAGIPRGAYHFFHPKQDPKAQAAHFCKVVGALGPDDLPCVLDWESNDNVAADIDVARGLVFLQEVERISKKSPIIYGGPYFLQALQKKVAPELAKYPLWIAHYTPKCPLVPDPWKYWTFHQFTDKGAFPGVGAAGHGTCDVNYFNGSADQLKALCKFSGPLTATAEAVESKAASPK